MEKFAVDLDAVLDEFEFHEDQAEKIAGRQSPSVTGFFSPLSEDVPPLPLLVSPPDHAVAISSQASPLSVRYDLPPAKLSPITETFPPSPLSSLAQDATLCQPSPLTSLTQENVSLLKINPVEPISDNEKENVDPNDVPGDVSEIVPSAIINAEVSDNVTSDTVTEVRIGEVDEGECGNESPPGYDQAMSLMEEMKEVSFLPGKSFETNKNNDDYVDQKQVEEYLKQMKVEEDDYVDERQVQEYLKEIELEQKEQNLMDKVSIAESENEEDEQVVEENKYDILPVDLIIPQSDVAPHEEMPVQEPEDTLEEIVEMPDTHLESLDTVLASLPTQTGARPKDTSPSPVVYRQPPIYSESDLVSALEPTIPNNVADPAPYIEEAEYLDLASLEADLQPQIGRKVEESPNRRATESPPPYSEVDPMVMAPPDSLDIDSVKTDLPSATSELGQTTSIRPTSLDLTGPGPAPSADSEAAAPVADADTESLSSEVVLGAPGATPSNPNGPRVGQVSLLAGLSEDQLLLGRVQPFWVPDSDAPNCMICGSKFTMVKRRHHCRACGKVLCAPCCNEKHALHYLEGKEGRVCTPCRTILSRLSSAEAANTSDSAMAEPLAPPGTSQPDGSTSRRPNPSNPMEYCSTIPVSEQVAAAAALSPPTVMVPVGVLKRSGGSTGGSVEAERENKSVMFSDGIRPGGDLT